MSTKEKSVCIIEFSAKIVSRRACLEIFFSKKIYRLHKATRHGYKVGIDMVLIQDKYEEAFKGDKDLEQKNCN